jgi:hypothetical protein
VPRFPARLVPLGTADIVSGFSARRIPLGMAGIMPRLLARRIPLGTAGIVSSLLARRVPGKLSIPGGQVGDELVEIHDSASSFVHES